MRFFFFLSVRNFGEAPVAEKVQDVCSPCDRIGSISIRNFEAIIIYSHVFHAFCIICLQKLGYKSYMLSVGIAFFSFAYTL